MLCFLEIMQLLVEETHRYHQYLDTLDNEHPQLSDMTTYTKCTVLLSVIMEIGYDQRDTLRY
jgi:hypothetical protein